MSMLLDYCSQKARLIEATQQQFVCEEFVCVCRVQSWCNVKYHYLVPVQYIDSYIIYLYKSLHSTLLQIRIHRLYSGVFVGGDPVKIVVHVSCVFIACVFLYSICRAE